MNSGRAGLIKVSAVSELLDATGSSSDETVALFVTSPSITAVTTMVIVANSASSKSAMLQVTTPTGASTHPKVAETNSTLSGNVSTSVIPVAVSGPRLVTTSV